MKQFLIIFLMMVVMSSVAVAGSYNSHVGILKMTDEAYQLKQQSLYCYLMTDTAKESKDCFLIQKAGYEVFVEYILSDSNDPLMDACIQDLMPEWWNEETNSTLWGGFMIDLIECYENN